MKRLTSIFLVLAMLLTLTPMNIFAAESDKTAFSDMKSTDYYADAATALEELGIISGYPVGTYGAEKSITRAEMAAIVCRIIDKEADAEKAKGETIFDDVSSDYWASGYINIAVREGIINGDGNGKFRPEDEVKYEEAIKMIVCALGYADGIETDPADWSKAYIDIAAAKGITSDLKGKKGEPATRGDIAVMSYNGIKATQADTKDDKKSDGTPVASVAEGTYTTSQKVTLSSSVEGAVIYYTTNGSAPTAKSKKYTKEIAISKTTTLKAIAVKDGKQVGDVMSVIYTIKLKSSGGGGGGGGSSKPSKTAIISAELQVNGAAVTNAKAGDVLTFVSNPANATGTITWYADGTDTKVTGTTYTVTAFDMGKKIKAQIVGTDSYTGTVTAECTVEKTTQVDAKDIMSNDVNSSPVVLTDAANTTFFDADGNTVAVDGDSKLTLSIDNPTKTTDEVEAAKSSAIQAFINGTSASESDLSDVTAIAVDVSLSLDETEVHPVGDVTVTLSAQQLGLPEGTDLTNYTFSANHTNKNGVNEVVMGTLVTIDNVQYIRFELNGLSTIWIGNIPPRLVSFYKSESDADNHVNTLASVFVKFGDLTPSDKIPKPTNSSYLFTGWNYDMTRTPVITNLDVHALWIKGEAVPADDISTSYSSPTTALKHKITNGSVDISSDSLEQLPADLNMTVSINPPADAAKYYVGTNATEVAVFDDESQFSNVTVVPDISFDVDLTDSDGAMIPSLTTYYYKWLDADGNVICIQSIEVKVGNGADSVTSKIYTANVQRGFGTFELYLTDSENAENDFVAYINNHLSGSNLNYKLYNNASFDSYRVDYDYSAYDNIKLVFTPYEGVTFSTSDVISATGEYYTDDYTDVELNGTYEIADGKLVVTYPAAAALQNSDRCSLLVTVNGVDAIIDVDWNRGVGGIETEKVDCDTWEDVLEAVDNASKSSGLKKYHIYYHGNAAVILTSSLTIPANVIIYMDNCSSFTIANGATLTLTEDKNTSQVSRISSYSDYSEFIVENGGELKTSYIGTPGTLTYLTSIDFSNIKLCSGAMLTVPAQTGLSSYSFGDEREFLLESGATVNNSGFLDINNFNSINIIGAINVESGNVDIEGDEININGTINMNNTDSYQRLELYGTVNVDTDAVINVNNTSSRNNGGLEIYGPLTNKGTIALKGTNAKAVIMNNGYTIFNYGTISAESGCSITASGTKYINRGTISGEGTLKLSLGDDYSNYDDGTEYVETENGDGYYDTTVGEYLYYLSDYPRYKFTHEPAKTVELKLYLGEVVNMGDGQCTINVEKEDFPQ